MIKQTCSNPDCKAELPLMETYYRKRLNGSYRTDCRKCEAKGRNARRSRVKKEKTPNCSCDETGHVTEHPAECPPGATPKTLPEFNVDLNNPESVLGAINQVVSAICKIVDSAKVEEDPESSECKVNHWTVNGDAYEDYFIGHNGIVYQAVEGEGCGRCVFNTKECPDGIECIPDMRKSENYVYWKATDIPPRIITALRTLRRLQGDI